MCQRADGNDIHAGFRNGTQRFERNTAGGLDQGFPLRHCDGFAHSFKAHIVEHNDLRARVQGLGHLIKIAGFHFNFYHMAKLSTQKSDRVGDATGGIDVVILEHRAVGEVVTVVFTAAADDCIFLQGAKARQCFAGIGN